MTETRSDLEPLPERLRLLPIDDRGYPVPWFVAWLDGVPEFRAMDPRKFVSAVRDKLCWVCGQPLGRWLAFPVGPMCTVNRTTPEPPSHRECATWSIRNCPFLAQPDLKRRQGELPEDREKPGGFALMRNPGVIALYITRRFEVFDAGGGKPLITMGEPEEVTWWREKRPATRAEVEASVNSGLPALSAMAQRDGPLAVRELLRVLERAQQLYPAATAPGAAAG